MCMRGVCNICGPRFCLIGIWALSIGQDPRPSFMRNNGGDSPSMCHSHRLWSGQFIFHSDCYI